MASSIDTSDKMYKELFGDEMLPVVLADDENSKYCYFYSN